MFKHSYMESSESSQQHNMQIISMVKAQREGSEHLSEGQKLLLAVASDNVK